MRSFLVFCAIACAIGTASSAATLTASPVSTGQDIGLFTIEFTDGNANGLLDYDEITSFPPVNTGTIFAGSQDAVRILQIPTIDGINTWFISRTARQSDLTVALSGVGGDERFAGYDTSARRGVCPNMSALLPGQYPKSWRVVHAD